MIKKIKKIKITRKKIVLALVCVFAISLVIFSPGKTDATPDANTLEQMRLGNTPITYEAFGAIGNGSQNDVDAIRAAHEQANDWCLVQYRCHTVYGKKGASYYIGALDMPISVLTSVNWNDATFILDDFINNGSGGNFVDFRHHIFDVRSTNDSLNIGKPLTIQGVDPIVINPNTKNLWNLIEYFNALTPEQLVDNGGFQAHQALLDVRRTGILQFDKILVLVENNNIRQFDRKYTTSGVVQQDLILIDTQTGDVLNDIQWDFNTITRIVFYPVDNIDSITKTPLTLSNATFIRHTNGHNVGNTHNRGIFVRRANVTFDNITYALDEEKHASTDQYRINPEASRYVGFIHTEYGTVNLTIKNSKFQPHQVESDEAPAINLNRSVNTSLDNVSYSCISGNDEECYKEFITHEMKQGGRGGILVANVAKDLVIKNSKLNRIDSFQGLHNMKITNSTIGSHGITVVGSGNFTAENVVIDNARFVVSLRGDVGASWRGNMTLKNITFNPTKATIPAKDVPRIIALDQVVGCANATGCGNENYNDGSHNFGFKTSFPTLTMDNIIINNDSGRATSLMPIYYNPTSAAHPYFFDGNIYIRNVRQSDGVALELFANELTIDQARFGNSHKTDMYIFDTKLKAESIFTGENIQFNLYINMRPQVEFVKNGGSAAGTHSTVVNVIETALPIKSGSLKYVWSQSQAIPADALFTKTFTNGEEITRNVGNGTWYLWVRAEDSFGNVVKQISRGFIFNNVPPAPATTQPPESTTPLPVRDTKKTATGGSSAKRTTTAPVDDGSKKIEVVEQDRIHEIPLESSKAEEKADKGMPVWVIVSVSTVFSVAAAGGYIIYLRPKLT